MNFKTILAALAALFFVTACSEVGSTHVGLGQDQMLMNNPPIEDTTRYLTQADQTQIDCLATNIYFEARGEGATGQEAVGHVTLNRVASGQFPTTVCGVVYQRTSARSCQFSWFCDGLSDRIRDRQAFEDIRLIAQQMYINTPPDITHGATFYHAAYVHPRWRGLKQTARIGAHIFYALV